MTDRVNYKAVLVTGGSSGLGAEAARREQDFYLRHGPMNGAGGAAPALRDLPRGIASLCEIAQGVLIHRDIAPWLYELRLSSEQRDVANIRPVARMVAEIERRSAKPLRETRAPAERMPCVCWHFSNLIAAILREQGVPARARCGFGAYFNPGRFEDHWVAEYWNRTERRWVLVDAQLDAVQRSALAVDFDPTNVPHNRFILAGDAWRQCRAGGADPELFGLSIIKEQGLWWVAQNLIRDLASLNRVEMLPWDVWGMMPGPTGTISDDDGRFLDRVAAVTLSDHDAVPALQEIYDDPRVKVPQKVFNADRKVEEEVPV
jgi:Transglutaminase-like superfamily